MNILDNELVRKYFGCESNDCKSLSGVDHDWLSCMSFRILRAMQEPIRKGERYLDVNGFWIKESIQEHDWDTCWHPVRFRLPDSFQKREDPHKGRMLNYCGHQNCEYEIKWSCGNEYSTLDKPEPPKCECGIDTYYHKCQTKDPVEGKIQDLMQYCVWGPKDHKWFVGMLRELVDLARAGK